MQFGGKHIRVMLKVDLNKYAYNLRVGEIGWTIPNGSFSLYGSQDRYVAVKFDSGVSKDILISSLQVVPGNTKTEKKRLNDSTILYARVSKDDMNCENQKAILLDWVKKEAITEFEYLAEEETTRKTRPIKDSIIQ